MNVAVVLPADTVTEPLTGTLAAAALSLDNVTIEPPAGAGPVSVTVPVELLSPPVTLVGFKLIEDRTGALTVRVAVFGTPR